jgi:signal transduction histidine kinase
MSIPRERLFVYGAFVVAILLFAAGLFIATYEDRVYRDQQVKDLTEQADILAASAAAAVAFDDAKAAQEYVDALTVNPDMRAARILDRQMKTLGHFSRAPQPATEDIRVMEPVRQNGQVMGYVLLVSSSEPIGRRLFRYVGLLLLGTMGAVMIAGAGVGGVVLQRRAAELIRLNERLRQEMAERALTEEALRQSQKLEAVGQLSGGIAHDFNNLIMIVKGSLRAMRKKGFSDSERYMAAADEALDRAASVTQRILAFSRRQALMPQKVNLSELAQGMHELISHSLTPSIALEFDLKSESDVLCDPNQMEITMLNLALNARDAMPDGGRLRVATWDCRLEPHAFASDLEGGDYVALAISDSGMGMSDETRERAVDPFFTTKSFGKGTGLGLSMAYGFVKQSFGHLLIESEEGKGTTITIYLPKFTGAA